MSEARQTEDVASFEVHVGGPESPDGRTGIRIERNGSFIITHDQAVGERNEEEEAAHEQVEGDMREILGIEPDRLFARVEAIEPRDDFPARLGVPDEPIIELTVTTSIGSRTTRMWMRDAEADSQVQQLLEPLRAIVERATDGQRFL